jgi:hypothetical protein
LPMCLCFASLPQGQFRGQFTKQHESLLLAEVTRNNDQ